MTRYRQVAARRAEGFPTTLCCAAARVSRQAFHGQRAEHRAGPTAGGRAEAALVAEIREIHASSGGAYRSARVAAELRARGRRVNVKRVARLMRANEIAGIRPRRPKRSAAPVRSGAVLPDLLGRRFSPGAPDRAQVSDITHVRTDAGWLYLAVVLDVGSRRLLGYAMSDRVDARLAIDALDMAANNRQGRTASIVFHTDRGSQYLAAGFPNTGRRVGPSAVGGPRRHLRGQRRRGGVLLKPQTRARQPAPLARPRHRPAGRVRVARPLQHHPAPHQPRLRDTGPARGPLPSHNSSRPTLNHLTAQRREVPCAEVELC